MVIHPEIYIREWIAKQTTRSLHRLLRTNRKYKLQEDVKKIVIEILSQRLRNRSRRKRLKTLKRQRLGRLLVGKDTSSWFGLQTSNNSHFRIDF